MLLLSTDRLLRSAFASKLAYAETPVHACKWPVSKQLHGNCCEMECTISKVIDVKRTGSHAYVWKSGPHSLVVAFRGSHDLLDLCNIVNAKQTGFDFKQYKTHIHTGVLHMFESIESELTKDIYGQTKTKHITFCGHSLGGALAQLAAAYYGAVSENNIRIECHTFGSPMVGADGFKSFHDDNVAESIHVTTSLDPVPRLPLFCAYKPVGSHLRLLTSTWNPLHAHDLDLYINLLQDKLRDQIVTPD
jgi:hypothetical protein